MTDDERAAALRWISRHISRATHWRQYARLSGGELRHELQSDTGIYMSTGEFIALMREAGYEDIRAIAYKTANRLWEGTKFYSAIDCGKD